MTNAEDRSHQPHRSPARTIECVSCHRLFLTRAGSGTLLCFICRTRFRSTRPLSPAINPTEE